MPDSTLAGPSPSLLPPSSTPALAVTGNLNPSPLRPEDSVSQLEKQRSVDSKDDDIDDLLRSHRSRGACANIGIAFCNLIPPLGVVAISRGHASDVALAFFLTLLFYIPGLVYAFHCQFSPRTSGRTQVPCLCGL